MRPMRIDRRQNVFLELIRRIYRAESRVKELELIVEKQQMEIFDLAERNLELERSSNEHRQPNGGEPPGDQGP